MMVLAILIWTSQSWMKPSRVRRLVHSLVSVPLATDTKTSGPGSSLYEKRKRMYSTSCY